MFAKSVLEHLLQNASTGQILCVGDLMLDRYLYGSADRISPEAPIPVVNINMEREMLGGSGNVVRNISSLGGRVHFVAVVGQDSTGDHLETILSSKPGVRFDLVRRQHGSTTVKTRIIADHQQIVRIDHDAPLMDEDIQQKVLQKALEKLKETNLVVLSDYGKGVLSATVIKTLIAKAREYNIPVIVDPKADDYSLYKDATVITPNLSEFQNAVGKPVYETDDIVEHARNLINENNFEHIIITRSKDGMTVVSKDGSVDHHATHALEVYDVSGAGDTVIASLSLALAQGLPISTAADLANLAAGVVVQKLGTATLVPDELLSAHDAYHNKSHEPFQAAPSPQSLKDVCDRVQYWKREGLTIGFTNGCFDLLHIGHLRSLRESRDRCDRLVVGLNSDESVRKLKGDSRPINQEIARAELLLGLECVDAVIIFGEDTPLKLITAIRPDVLVKGADYELKDIVGAREVLSWGGQVHRVKLVEGHSTTSMIAKSKVSSS